MSRIGKHPVSVPSGVTLAIDGQKVSAKGKLGELAAVLPPEVSIVLEDNAVTVAPRDRSLTGLFNPCSTGPTATAPADRCTAL